MRTLSCAILLLLVVTVAPSARAESLPLTRSVRLGRPARALPLRVEALAGVVRLRVGPLDAPLPLATASDATVEELDLAGGGVLAVLRISDGPRRVAALIARPAGRPELLWSGRTDLHGDPGERSAGWIEVADRTGDGIADIVVGTIAEAARICGAERTILGARAFDPRTQTLRPVTIARFSGNSAAEEIVATIDSPGPEGAPILGLLRVGGASSHEGHGDDPSALAAPRVLERPGAGYWAEGRGGSGRGEFVSARLERAGLAVRALAITPSPEAPIAARLGRPRTLWVVGDGGARFHVTLPEDAALHPGRRYWIVPREPLTWGCLSVVLDDAHLPAGTTDAETRTALAGLEAYTDLDFPGGLERLVRVLVGDGPDAGQAADALARVGAASVAPTVEAWPRMSPAGRKRAVRVLATSARAATRDAGPLPARDAAVAALVVAAGDTDTEVREAALGALAQAGDAGVSGLAQVTAAGGAGLDVAARRLAEGGTVAVGAILAAVGAPGGTERPALRDALARALRVGGAAARDAVEGWLAAETRPPGVRAALALGLAAAPEGVPTAMRLAAASPAPGAPFPERYRLTLASARLPAEPDTDAWLDATARGADEWMLRAAAIGALHARGSTRLAPLARVALADAYPRVRVAAVRALGASRVDVEAIARVARDDAWPLVRAEAVRQLAQHPEARPAIRAALSDPRESVRAAAVGAVTQAGDRGAWPLVAARLQDDDEWPVVIESGLALARERCAQDAREAVIAVLRRGLRDDAWAPDAELAALALETAVTVGGALGDEARQMAERSASSEALRAAARRLRERPTRTCGETPPAAPGAAAP